MPLDANIFLQYAALRDSQNKQLQASIGAGLDSAYKNKALGIEQEKAKLEGFDVGKLGPQALVKAYMGQELTPQDQAILKAWDATETRKLAPDATGNYRKINSSIFDGTGFDMGNLAPVSVPSGAMPVAGIDSPQYGGPIGDMGAPKSAPELGKPLFESDLPAMDLTPLPPVAEKPSGFDTSIVAPESVLRQPITVPPELSGNPNATQKYLESAAAAQASMPLEVAKAKATEQAKLDVKNQEKTQSEGDTLPILKDMLSQNKKTNQLPYASMAQPVTRFTNPDQATNMDLLKQNRLDMAAPLAKQLGVSPTDKDFQATLDRIFDETASGPSRDAQIKNLIHKIERRQGKELTKFPETKETKIPKIEGKRVRQKSTGKTGTIVNGEFVPD